MFKSLSISKRLFASFAAILIIFLTLLTIAYSCFSSLSDANRADRHTLQVIQAIDQLRMDLLQVQVEARGYYLTGKPERLERTRKELHDLPASIQNLQDLTHENAAQVSRFKKLESLISNWAEEVIDAQLKLRQSLGNTPGAADAMGRTGPLVGGNSVIGKSTNSWTRLCQKRTSCWQNDSRNQPVCRPPCAQCW
ncbi:CHASE3 domain-containing protein [Pseudoduganella sp. UC29_106]|uniref:CHASE3 domain-containing protein n=1 Tax=Pseudoduganella sp. UC29_106 TaxID=3374553 RepID=UPI003757AEBF